MRNEIPVEMFGVQQRNSYDFLGAVDNMAEYLLGAIALPLLERVLKTEMYGSCADLSSGDALDLVEGLHRIAQELELKGIVTVGVEQAE